jgi:hypothetical protein
MSKRNPLPIGLLSLFLSLTGYESGFAADSLPKIGEMAKDFELFTVDGSKVKLTTILEKSSVVLVVLRGFSGISMPCL